MLVSSLKVNLTSIIFSLITLTHILGCNKICDAGLKISKEISYVISSRWDCDYVKINDYLSNPINKYICRKQKPSEQTERVDSLGGICPYVINLLVNIPASKLSSKFNCNSSKIKKDLKHMDKLCFFLAQSEEWREISPKDKHLDLR